MQFDDGLGEDLVGDEEDMRKLNDMTEAERELELFKRSLYVHFETFRFCAIKFANRALTLLRHSIVTLS